MLHTSLATQIQQCIAKPGFCVANCDAIPDVPFPVITNYCLQLNWHSKMSIITELLRLGPGLQHQVGSPQIKYRTGQ